MSIKMPSPEEIERIKMLRDAGAPAPAPAPETKKAGLPRYRQRYKLPPRDEEFDRSLISRMNGREQAGLLSLGAANALLSENVPDGLEKRIRKLRAWWRYKGAMKTLQRVQDLVEQSAEDDQRLTLSLRVRHLNVHIGMDRVLDPEGTWVRVPDLNTVIGTVLEDHCGLCMLDDAGAQKCELRKALRAMTTISEREVAPAANGCLYKRMNVMDEWEL